jgi:hypothetical protein
MLSVDKWENELTGVAWAVNSAELRVGCSVKSVNLVEITGGVVALPY